MRILWLKTELLHPVDKGGRIRTYQMLRRISERHQVTYACLDDGDGGDQAIVRAAEYAQEVVRVSVSPRARKSVGFVAGVVRSTVGALPLAVAAYGSPRMRNAVAALLARRHFDIIVCDFLAASVNLPPLLPCPLVLFQHNVEAAIWRRRYELARDPLTRSLLYDQWRKLERYEREMARRADFVVTVSDDDARVHRECYGISHVAAVPTGVDLSYFQPQPATERRTGQILFLGSLDWEPNEDAITFFVRAVLPSVRARYPAAVLTVVGRRPTQRLRAFAASGAIDLVGGVEDVRPWLARCAAFVVPLRVGGGTRLKIFEAMAMGAPVISTTIGAEGLPLEPGRDLLVADGAQSFADAVLRALRDPAMAMAMATSGMMRVRERFGWEPAVERFEALCVATRQRRALAATG